jgi:hypothetical protein
MIWVGCSNSTAKQALDMPCLACAADLMPFMFVLNDESCRSSHALGWKHSRRMLAHSYTLLLDK